MRNTKDEILSAALNLFAADGYEGISVSMIADKLGITKGALYRHYKSKQDIFEHIIKKMQQQDETQAKSCNLPEGSLADMGDKYLAASPEDIVKFSKAQFIFWTEDSFAANFRKMLTIEQHRSKEMNELYQNYFGTGPLGYVIDLFSSIGVANPELSALELYAPMFFLYTAYDSCMNTAAVKKLANEHFNTISEKLKKERL